MSKDYFSSRPDSSITSIVPVLLDLSNEAMVSELHKLNIENQTNNEDLEQYGRRLCLRIDGVQVVENETSVDVLASVKKLFDDAQVEISNAVIDRARRIGGNYVDRKSKKSCKSIIVRFTTFRHRTMFYRAKSN